MHTAHFHQNYLMMHFNSSDCDQHSVTAAEVTEELIRIYLQNPFKKKDKVSAEGVLFDRSLTCLSFLGSKRLSCSETPRASFGKQKHFSWVWSALIWRSVSAGSSRGSDRCWLCIQWEMSSVSLEYHENSSQRKSFHKLNYRCRHCFPGNVRQRRPGLHGNHCEQGQTEPSTINHPQISTFYWFTSQFGDLKKHF